MTKKKNDPTDPDPVPDPAVVEEVIQDTTEAIQDTTEAIQDHAQESAAIVEETVEPQPAPANPVTRGIDQLFERLDQIDQRLDAMIKPKTDQPIVNTQAEKKEVKENAPKEKPRSKRINLFRRSKS